MATKRGNSGIHTLYSVHLPSSVVGIAIGTSILLHRGLFLCLLKNELLISPKHVVLLLF